VKEAANRAYTLKKRAEQQAETRRRIVEAAVDLHSRLGPARTPVSLIAEHAGVQRKTFYAHFPDDRSLHLACSGQALQRDPLPHPDGFRAIDDVGERLRAGLSALYDWYARNAEMTANVLRDAEYHALTREMVELRFGPPIARIVEVLGEGLGDAQRAMLLVAVSFHTWSTLVRHAGADRSTAVELMVRAVEGAGA
jgi:AcrR family transcriptional regulator